MATPELVVQTLDRSRASGSRSAPQPGKKSSNVNNVIKFDAAGTSSQTPPSPRNEAVASQSRPGFVYDGVRAGRRVRAGLSRRAAASRPLPMEEVCLYIKPVDNSQIRRQPDPADKSNWDRLIALGLVAMFVVIASHAPRALLRHVGYRLENLHEQQQALADINEQLKVRQATLSDLRRVTALATKRGLAATPAGRFAWLDRTTTPPAGDKQLAQNRLGSER